MSQQKPTAGGGKEQGPNFADGARAGGGVAVAVAVAVASVEEMALAINCDNVRVNGPCLTFFSSSD